MNGLRRLRDAVVDTRVVGTLLRKELAAWLGDEFVEWGDSDAVVVRQLDGFLVTVAPGWLLVRWPDGGLTVASPRAAERIYPPAPVGETADAEWRRQEVPDTDSAEVRVVRELPDTDMRLWLGDDLIRWDANGLVVRNADGDPVEVPAGWALSRWPSGELLVQSPRAARLVFGSRAHSDS